MTTDKHGQLYELVLTSPKSPKRAKGRSLNITELAQMMGQSHGRVARMFVQAGAKKRRQYPPAADLQQALVSVCHLDPRAVTEAIDADFDRPRSRTRDELDLLVDGFRNQLRELFDRPQA